MDYWNSVGLLAEFTLLEKPNISIDQLAKVLQCSKRDACQWKRFLDLTPTIKPAKPAKQPTYKTGFFVYKITNSVNTLLYIGCTTMTLSKRWENHRCSRYSKIEGWKPLYQDMLKYGIEHFTVELIAECENKFEMLQYETKAILQHNTIWPNGYNLKIGRMRDIAFTDARSARFEHGEKG